MADRSPFGALAAGVPAMTGWVIYQGRHAVVPEWHQQRGWYFQPTDWEPWAVFSPAYPSKAEATRAASRV